MILRLYYLNQIRRISEEKRNAQQAEDRLAHDQARKRIDEIWHKDRPIISPEEK